MFKREVAADLVVDDDRTDGVGLQFAADHRSRNAALLQVGQEIDIEEQPVGKDNESFDAAVKQHFQVTLEAAALVVHVSKNGQIGGLVQCVFNASQHQGAVRVGHVEDHDTHGVAALAAQGAGKLVGTVSEFLGGALDA